MVKVRRVGLLSAARFGFWLGFASILARILFILVMMALNGIPPTAIPLEEWIEAMKFMVIVGLMSAFSIFVFAVIYNWSTSIFGGLELEIELPTAEETLEKTKNDIFED
jgi:hypothetical protein